MIDAAILGGVTGALARIAPEVLKVLDRGNERKHELKMNELELEKTKVLGAQQKDITQLQADSSQVTAAISAISTAYQNMKTGFKLADVVSALIRPWVTIIIVSIWLSSKVATYVVLAHGGVDWATAISTAWGQNDWAMLSGVLNFWFLGRVFEKRS